MGNQKLKWTSEEEDALHRGVQKHGPGKWKNILRDPEFAPFLTNRSNIDLKDKWRNLGVASGQISKEKSRTPKIKATASASASVSASASASVSASASASASVSAPAPAPAPSPASALVPAPQNPIVQSSEDAVDLKNSPRYNAMVFEALSTINDAKGSDINAIIRFIAQKHKVPQNFRKALGSRLRRLVNQGKLEKVENCYKIKNDASSGTKPPAPKSPAPKQREVLPWQSPASSFLTTNASIKEAAEAAAYRVAEAENKSFLAAEAFKEVEKISRLAEDTDSTLQLAKEIYEQCSRGEIILLA